MKIGILTGGGDVPGLNPCIKAVVNRATEAGHQVVGIRHGWDGLLSTNPDDPESVAANIVPLDPMAVRTIDRSGGTVLHTSRTNPGKVSPRHVPSFLAGTAAGEGPFDFTSHVLRVIESQGIGMLIPIGGDDTLFYAVRVHQEGVPVIAIPKTMDNDVFGTDYCIGFSTAVTRGVQFVNNLRTAVGSHERIGVVELFGRYSGQTSLVTAYLAGVDRAVISEVPVDVVRLAELLLKDKKANPSNYAIMTISEGAVLEGGDMILSGDEDAFGHRKLGGVGVMAGEAIRSLTGEGIINQQVAYLMRSGSPDSLDLMVATNYGVMAADLAHEGLTGRLVVLRSGTYTSEPVDIVRQGVKRVDVDELYDINQYRPKVHRVDGKPMFLY